MNPIIHKEVLQSLRTRKSVAMQVLLFVVTAVLLWLLWPAGGVQDPAGMSARRMLTAMALGELLMVVLFAPAFTATSLTVEKERNTLESLLATRMSPWQIAVGKMAGSLAFLVLLVISGIPALAALPLLGGVSIAEVLAVAAVLLVSAVYLGMIALLISAVMRRSYRAIIVTYAVLLVVVFGLAFPVLPASGKLIHRAGAAAPLLHVLGSFSPLQAMLSLVSRDPHGPYASGAAGWPAFWKLYLVAAAALTAVVWLVVLRSLHRHLLPRRAGGRPGVVERGGGLSARRVMFLVDPRKRKRMIGWWINPVLAKECRTRPTLQLHWLLRVTAICLIVSIALMFLVNVAVGRLVSESFGQIGNMSVAVAVLMVVLIVLVGPSFASGAICSDRETGLWDLLRVTPLPGWRIVSGKFQACFIPLALLVIGTAPALVILLVFDAALGPRILRILQVVAVTCIFVTMLGMFFSSVFSRTAAATVWTYAVMLVISVLTLTVLLDPSLFGPRLVGWVFTTNPIAAAMDAAGHRSMERYDVFRPHLRLMLAASAALFVLTVLRVRQLFRAE